MKKKYKVSKKVMAAVGWHKHLKVWKRAANKSTRKYAKMLTSKIRKSFKNFYA